MMKKLVVAFAVACALTAAFATSNAQANPAEPAHPTLGCYSNGTPCDHAATCCSGACLHHKCVRN